MPVYNIISRKLKQSQFVVQKIDDGKPLRTVLPFISRKLGIPSMKNYVAFSCSEKRPVARLDMDIPLEDQDVSPSSYIYVSPMDATPKGPDGEELPLALELKRKQTEKWETDMPPPPQPPPPPPPPPSQDDRARKRDEEERARKRDEEERARKRDEEERARKRDEEERARKRDEEERVRKRDEEDDERKLRLGGTWEMSGGFGLQKHSNPVKCCASLDTTQSAGLEHRVQLQLVPDVITIANEEEASPGFKPGVSGDFARKLVPTINVCSLHHAVLLQLAELLISNRPNRPQLYLWSHLQGKLCGFHVVTRSEKREARVFTARKSPTFAPVGNTVYERLFSGSPSGPARAVQRYWAGLVLDVKPDNPLLFMWSKLEARVCKDPLGVAAVSSTGTVPSEDQAKASLLRNIPRCAPSYQLLHGLVDLIFEKKPDFPETWILYHLVGRFRSNRLSSGRFSGITVLHGGDEGAMLESSFLNYKTTTVDCGNNDTGRRSFGHFVGAGVEFFLSCNKKNMRLQTKDAFTQTVCDSYKEANFSNYEACASRRKNLLVVPAVKFLHNRSPRQLLQLPPSDLLSLHRGPDAIASDLEPSITSPFFYEKLESICDPLRYSGTSPPKRSRAACSHRCFSHPSVEQYFVNRRSKSGEGLMDSEVRQSTRDQMSPCNRGSPPVFSSFSGTSDLQYAVRRSEMERAEALYEYNWLLQRQLLRNERLEKEVELLRREKEVCERMLRRDPSASFARETESVAFAQAEAEARLAKLKEEGMSSPSELDAIRRRLELLEMEVACSRHLLLSPQRFTELDQQKLIDIMAERYACRTSALRSPGVDCPESSPRLK